MRGARNGSRCSATWTRPVLGISAEVPATAESSPPPHALSLHPQLSASRPPIPTLLAIGAVHHHLIRTGLRTETSIVAETAQCFSTHQLAVMVGYGAHAVCPYLAFETARQWRVASR